MPETTTRLVQAAGGRMRPLSQLVQVAYDRYAGEGVPLPDLQRFIKTLSSVLREEERRQERDLATFG
jgi:hypothetical protein